MKVYGIFSRLGKIKDVLEKACMSSDEYGCYIPLLGRHLTSGQHLPGILKARHFLPIGGHVSILHCLMPFLHLHCVQVSSYHTSPSFRL